MAESVANPTPTQVLGRVSECMRRLMEAGLPFAELQKPIDDPEFRKHLVDFWMGNCFLPTSVQALAREIMGWNMFGIEEAIKHFGVAPTKQEITFLSDIPFSEATLRECKDTHILVAVFPISILTIRRKRVLFSDQDWYINESFAKDAGGVNWQLIRKTSVPNSISKTWQEQQALLTKDEETPSARTMVYAIIGHFLATGERLFEKIFVRCSDVGSVGNRVFVGGFDSDGLGVNGHWVDSRYVVLGLSSARK